MKIVFCGTPDFAVASLRALLEAGHDVPLVLTQPDKPAGRGMEVSMSAVKKFALAQGVEVAQPTKLKTNQELLAQLESISPDVIVVVAYGRIIPQWMLDLPPLGNLNVHGSLLPKYRGAAPVQWAVANGETETGVTIMRLDAGLDTGPMLLKRSLPIAPDALASTLFPQLATLGAEALLETLRGLEAGTIAPEEQDHAQATLAPILTRDDGALALDVRTAQQAYDRWRGFYPWPGSHGILREKRFLIHKMKPIAHVQVPNQELLFSNGNLLVGAANHTALVLEEVQIEGKPRMPGAQFARDFQLKAGERLV